MSPMNISNKICEMGEVNYETCASEYNHVNESVIIANDILAEILESAMDIAICANSTNETKKMNIIDEIQDEYMDNCTEIKDIIEGLSKINVSNLPNKNPEPVTLDVEMKRLLTEMMAPPFEIVNYETLPRKDGVGDQPEGTNQTPERDIDADEEENKIVMKPSKTIEKKSRVTDLVMNSKKVLNNLLDEEERKRLEEWEENNEHVIQVIELQSKKMQGKPKREISPEIIPLPYDEDESDLLQKPNEDTMESVELSETKKGGEGDDISKQISGDCCTIANSNNPITSKSKSASFAEKKKKWNFNFKFLTFKKKPKAHAVDSDRAN